MSFNGGGVFQINSTGQPVQPNTLIESAVFNALTADLATGLSNCVTKDGQQTVTANIPMNGNVFTGLGAGAAAGQSVRYEQLGLLYNPNLLINGDGMVYQRFVSAATNADDTYAFDRWNVLTQSNPILVTRLADAANNTPFMMRHAQPSASAQRFGTSQIFESTTAKRLCGQTITVQVKHKISSSANIRIAVLEWTGTADSVTSDVVADWTSASYTAGGFFLGANLTVTQVSSAIASTSALATASLTTTLGSSCNNLIVMVWTEAATAQNVTLDLAVKLEQSAFATIFESRDYGAELALCQRFCYAAAGQAGNIGIGMAASTTVSRIFIPFPVPLRQVSGTLVISGAANFSLFNFGATSGAATAIALAGSASFSAILNVTTTAGSPTIVAGDGVYLEYSATTSASALLIPAEL